MPDTGLFKTIISLANLGFIGVGVIVFLFTFILLFRGKPMTAANAQLQHRFLTMGFSFTVLCAVMALAGPWLAPPATVSTPHSVTLAFSPSFEVVKLPQPHIQLPDGSTASPSKPFLVTSDMQIVVSVDAAFEQVKELGKTASLMTDNAGEYRKQRDALLVNLPDSVEVTALKNKVSAASVIADDFEIAVKNSLAAGKFAQAASTTKMLSTSALNSTVPIQNAAKSKR